YTVFALPTLTTPPLSPYTTLFRSNPTSTLYTPGAPNSVRAALAPFPALWINEIESESITGLADNSGERDPWVELYNSGTNTVSRSEEHTSELQSRVDLVCRLLLVK